MNLPSDRDAYRAHLQRRLIECHIPATLHEGLIEYLAARRPTGDFLRAVLGNNLQQTCGRADIVNRSVLYELVCFLNNFAPGQSWGSPGAVEAWLSETEDPPLVFE